VVERPSLSSWSWPSGSTRSQARGGARRWRARRVRGGDSCGGARDGRPRLRGRGAARAAARDARRLLAQLDAEARSRRARAETSGPAAGPPLEIARAGAEAAELAARLAHGGAEVVRPDCLAAAALAAGAVRAAAAIVAANEPGDEIVAEAEALVRAAQDAADRAFAA
jgi:hypothetical protein